MTTHAVFITATGTGVGKTVISSLLFGYFRQQGLKTAYQKWVSTGGEIPEDLIYCLENNNLEFEPGNLDNQVTYRFLMPASPHLASEREGKEIDPEKIKEFFDRGVADNEVLIVEGVGGVLVPLRRDLLLADFLIGFHLPILVVAASGLGTINHTLLTIEALRQRNLAVLGVVFSDEHDGLSADDPLAVDNILTIGEIARVNVFGRLARCADYALLEKNFKPIGHAIWQKLLLH